MKKIFLILLGISFSFSAFAMGPYEPQDSIINDVISDKSDLNVPENTEQSVDKKEASDKKTVGDVASDLGTVIKSGFTKAVDAVGLSKEDIDERKAAREVKKANKLANENNEDDKNKETEEFDDPDVENNSNIEPAPVKKEPAKELKKAADKSDQSVMSKVVGSVSTAAMGIGGMELAQGLSEQKSDKAATAEMQNYLSNLYCTYSDKQVKYGVTDVKIDDGNNLDLLREEFLTKAATLKYTKEQLGLKAGLESEVVFDDAATALYNNQGTSRGESKFGRLSEAIMDETGSDAQIIAAQQEKSKNRVTGGAIAVVGGVAASIGGNALINSIGNKDKNAEVDEGENTSTNETAVENDNQNNAVSATAIASETAVENDNQKNDVSATAIASETTPNMSGTKSTGKINDAAFSNVSLTGNNKITAGFGGESPLGAKKLGAKFNTTPTTTPLINTTSTIKTSSFNGGTTVTGFGETKPAFSGASLGVKLNTTSTTTPLINVQPQQQ